MPVMVSTITMSSPIAAIPEIIELNIGHSIVARAIIDGLAKAVRDMKELMCRARAHP